MRIRDLIELTKLRITSAVAITTTLGFVLAGGSAGPALVAAISGVLLLACGSAAFNQLQEREIDARMGRTRSRPIPAGRISAGRAGLVAAALTAAGALVLLLWSSIPALALGLATMVWYNGVYTYLKKVSSFAVLPGAMVGALPPLIGWTAAGGSILARQPLALAAFFYVWQIPHFWLLLLRYGKEYEHAKLPSLTKNLSQRFIARVTFFLLLVTAASTLLFPAVSLVRSSAALAALTLMSIALLWEARMLLAAPSSQIFKRVFVLVNVYGLAVIAVLLLERVL